MQNSTDLFRDQRKVQEDRRGETDRERVLFVPPSMQVGSKEEEREGIAVKFSKPRSLKGGLKEEEEKGGVFPVDFQNPGFERKLLLYLWMDGWMDEDAYVYEDFHMSVSS